MGGSPDPDAAPASALKLAAPRLAAASASGPEGGELKSTAQATALANAARNAPGEIARSVDLAALGSTLARALRRLVAAREDEGAAPAREGLVGERPALTVAVAGSVGPVVAPGAAALTSTAVSSPEAVVRSASVADAIASLHVDDRGVAIIRVERTALGAIEAHVARHGADVTVRLRAVDSEHQARLLHALPAVRRELDASELFIGRVDVRGDVPTDAFGRGASGQAQTGDTSDAPAWTDLADPEPVIGAPSPVARPARATHPQPGERRRLLVIA